MRGVHRGTRGPSGRTKECQSQVYCGRVTGSVETIMTSAVGAGKVTASVFT